MNYNNSTKMQILRAIKDSGQRGVENWKLSNITLGYRGRITELRHDGYDIRARRIFKQGKASGTFVYHIAVPEPTAPPVVDEVDQAVNEAELQQIRLMDTPKDERRSFF